MGRGTLTFMTDLACLLPDDRWTSSRLDFVMVDEPLRDRSCLLACLFTGWLAYELANL